MRARLRWLVVALLAAVLGTGAWLIKQSFDARRRAEQTRVVVDMLPNVAQRIHNFHRVKVDNGRKVWEVSARDAQYLEGDQVVVVDAPRLDIYLADGRTVSLHGDAGKVFLKDRELQRVEMTGSVEAQLDTYAVYADTVQYEAEDGVIVSPGRVRITGSDFEMLGDRMKVNVADQRLMLSERVQTTLQPRS